jgi:hypothetical protein
MTLDPISLPRMRYLKQNRGATPGIKVNPLNSRPGLSQTSLQSPNHRAIPGLANLCPTLARRTFSIRRIHLIFPALRCPQASTIGVYTRDL